MNVEVDAFGTIIIAVIVLGIGRYMQQHIAFLRNYNIPEPVVGGLIAALAALVLYQGFDVSASFDRNIQNILMLMFFSSIGLSASLSKLKQGGKALGIFLICVALYVLLQNAVGMSLATLLGLDPLIGLIVGSITLTGGHGTAGAWGGILTEVYGIQGAVVLGMASATFGLIIGGVIGGPVAKFLINHYQLKPSADQYVEDNSNASSHQIVAFQHPDKTRLITATDAVQTLGQFALCIFIANYMTQWSNGQWFELPTFVWALATGMIIRNSLELVFKQEIFDRAIDVFGNASLSLYLAMALLSLQLWLLADLAGPLLLILIAQTIVLALYTGFVTFRVMGKDYDAAVLVAGQCGFGMGATPTAIANIQAVTNMYGPSHKAFLIIPLCGAFFVDIINAFVIQTILKFF